jgi:hypothetical protein
MIVLEVLLWNTPRRRPIPGGQHHIYMCVPFKPARRESWVEQVNPKTALYSKRAEIVSVKLPRRSSLVEANSKTSPRTKTTNYQVVQYRGSRYKYHW